MKLKVEKNNKLKKIKMKKLLSIALAVSTITWLGASFVPVAHAAVVDGDIVSATTTFADADGNTYYPYDVFIVKIVGSKTFKRLILNPQVFTSYGHLKWSNLKKLSADTVKGYTTSALVRPINEEPVYVLAPNGDSGTKQWVDDLTCFNSKGYDWDSVYVINAVDAGNYSTISSLCGTTTSGNMTLSLASDTPVAATLPMTAQGVTFAKYSLTGTGTLNQIAFKRDGAGSVEDFDNLYIYKDGVRLTAGRSITTSTSKVTFINLGITAPATFELVADISGTAGNVNYFTVESVSDVVVNGTIGGSFPIKGNTMGISGTAAGTLTVAKSGAAARNVTIGALQQEISQFKVTTATEGANISRIQLFNGGTADNALVTNLKLKDQTGTVVATASNIGSNGYVSFVFNAPYYIAKGESEIFYVYADIGAQKPDRTIILYQELATDILAKGTTYGYGMTATITNFTSTSTAVTVTCKGGDLTLAKVGPNATSIGTTTSDTVFLEFTMSAAADITVKRTELIYCQDADGDGTYDDVTSAGAGLEDIKVKEKDSGVIVAGPKDGTAFNDGTRANCPGGKNGAYEDFTDTIDLTAGTTKTYQVTADVKTANAAHSLASGSKIKFMLYSYATLVGATGNVNYMKYAGTSDAVPGTSIAPSGDIAGDEMTIAAASLAISLAASPSGNDVAGTEKVYIKGQSGVTAVGFVFTAGSASDITVNSIQLTGYTTENTGVALIAGKDTNYVKDTVGTVYIYDKDTGAMVPGSSAKGFTSGTDYENVDFTGLSWVIPAGTSKTLLVKNDISSAAPASASTADTWIGFDIVTAASDVSAVDKDGNTVDATGNAQNPLAATVNYGVASYGSLAIDGASDTPDKSLVVMGTADNEISKFKLTGTSEAWYLETFSVALNDGQESGEPDTANRDNFSAVKIKYQTEAQWGTSAWTFSAGQGFGSTASLAFNFSGTNRIYVPKDDNAYVTVLASIADYNGGSGAKSKVPFKLLDIDGSSSSLKAYGAQSGTLLTSYTTNNSASTDYNLHFVTRSKPVFAKVSSTASNELARFTITAVGYDVIFDGISGSAAEDLRDIASAALRFDVIASTTDDASINLYLYDWNENVVASREGLVADGDNNILDGTVTSVSFIFEEKDVTIPAGTTKEFHVDLAAADANTDFLKTDEFIYLQLRNDDNVGLANAGDTIATGSMGFGERDIVWHDGTNEEGICVGTYADCGDPELRFGMPSLIKNVGPLPITFTVLRGTAAP